MTVFYPLFYIAQLCYKMLMLMTHSLDTVFRGDIH